MSLAANQEGQLSVSETHKAHPTVFRDVMAPVKLACELRRSLCLKCGTKCSVEGDLWLHGWGKRFLLLLAHDVIIS